jgi:hypothetical protein
VRRTRHLVAVLGLVLGGVFVTAPAHAIPFFFSIDAASPSVGVLATESDMFASPGPIGGPPVLAVPAGALGLLGLGFDDVNAMAVGSPGFIGQVHFSVDRASTGVAPSYGPDVLSEAAAGDVFVIGNLLAGIRLPLNSLAYNQDINGPLPGIASGLPAAPPIDPRSFQQ